MEPVLSTYGLAYVLSALVPLAAVPHTWRHRTMPGARWMLLVLIAASFWTFTNGMAYAQFSDAVRIEFSRMSYFTSGSAPVFFFLFAIEYASGGRRVRARTVAALLAVPAITVIAAYTNPLHHLIWTEIHASAVAPETLYYGHGAFYWMLLLYGMTLAAMSLPIIYRHARRTLRLRRNHILMLGAAIAITIVAEVLYSFFPDVIPGFDAAMVVGFAGSLVALTLFRSRLLEPIPIARESLLDQIPEGLIVLDDKGALIDLNMSTLRLLRIPRAVVGQPLVSVLAGWEGFERLGAASGPEAMSFLVVTPWGTPISVRSWALFSDAGIQVGRAATLVDLTQEHEAQSAVAEVRRNVDLLVDEMQGIAGEFRMDTP